MAWYNPFSWGKEKKEQQGPAAQFLKPIRARETVPGNLAFKELERRLQGVGIGYDPKLVSKATAPYATARREGFRRFEAPAISAAASARGLGRSTIPVAQTGLAAQTAERDIEQRVADLSVRSEEKKRSEISDALARLQVAGQAEAGTINIGKAANVAEFERQQRIRNAEVDRKNTETAQFQALAALGIGAATGQPGVGTILAGVATSAEANEGISLIDALIKQQEGGATVDIARNRKFGLDRMEALESIMAGRK